MFPHRRMDEGRVIGPSPHHNYSLLYLGPFVCSSVIIPRGLWVSTWEVLEYIDWKVY